jgi:uncharacterized membrane protein YozB (DUF420 family)
MPLDYIILAGLTIIIVANYFEHRRAMETYFLLMATMQAVEYLLERDEKDEDD